MYRAKRLCHRDVFLNSNCLDSSGQFFYMRGNICRYILRNMYIFFISLGKVERGCTDIIFNLKIRL